MSFKLFALLGAFASLATVACDNERPCLTEGASRKLDCECPEGMHIDFKAGSKTDSFCAADDAGTKIDPSRGEKGDSSLARADASDDANQKIGVDGSADSRDESDAEAEPGDTGVAAGDAEAELVDSTVVAEGEPVDSAVPPVDAKVEPVDSAIAAKLNLGAVCNNDGQCESGHCTDGVCCNSADCAGSCRSCNVPGTALGTCSHYDDSDVSAANDAPTGTCPSTCTACDGSSNGCVNVSSGQDWKNVCATTLTQTCGTTGACDGLGACQLYGKETSCDDGAYCNGTDTCNGAGACAHGGDPCASVACGTCSETSKSCLNRETWYDTVNDLTWEIAASPDLLGWFDANAYCTNKSHCGNDHWRLPSIGELRQQTRGCASTSNFIDGPCIVNQSLSFENFGAACSGCTANGGPAPGGCYRPTELEGPCGHLWSSTITQDSNGNATDNAWVVLFGAAKLEWFPLATKVRVRCVRSGM